MQKSPVLLMAEQDTGDMNDILHTYISRVFVSVVMTGGVGADEDFLDADFGTDTFFFPAAAERFGAAAATAVGADETDASTDTPDET